MKYAEGANLTILNCRYNFPFKDEDGKRHADTMEVVYKNNDTGEKEMKIVKSPLFTFYTIKDEYVKPYGQLFIEEEHTIPHTVKYSDHMLEIAKILGRADEFYDNIRSGNARLNRRMHEDPRLMASDIPIEVFYRMEFNRKYKNDICNVTKAYLDIETDIRYIDNRFPEPGECPVNAISLLIEENNTIYTFLLRDKRNPKIDEFINYMNSVDFIGEFKSFLVQNVGGPKKLEKLGLDKLKFNISFFDSELELITSCFNVINITKPDFVLAWNMSFDMPFLIERLRVLGVNPEDVICHPDFKRKVCKYIIDTHNTHEPAKKSDKASISSYSVYLDQLIQFAARRKNQSAFKEFKLDYIGDIIAGCKKLDYHYITPNLGDLPYIDYKIFVMYNMMDVLVQKAIEEKTGDINFVFNSAILNSTEYHKIFKNTAYLANKLAMFLREDGYIVGNNLNRSNENKEAYEGAFVADPVRNMDKNKVKLLFPNMRSVTINLVRNVLDFDYKALYPSETDEHNIAPNTQIGKIIMPTTIWDGENDRKSEIFERSGDFLEHFSSHNWLQIGHRYLKLATYSEMLEDIYEYFTKFDLADSLLRSKDGKITVYSKTPKDRRIRAIHKADKLVRVVNKYIPMPEGFKKKIIDGLKQIEVVR